MSRIFGALLLFAYVLQAGTNYINCGSKVGHYTSVSVTDCDENERECLLKRGSNATITIVFNVDNLAKNVKAQVHGVINGVPIPFPISQPNACETSGLTCPLEKDKGPFTYENTLYIQPIYPKMAVKVKWELKDEEDNDIICVEIPSKIA